MLVFIKGGQFKGKFGYATPSLGKDTSAEVLTKVKLKGRNLIVYLNPSKLEFITTYASL